MDSRFAISCLTDRASQTITRRWKLLTDQRRVIDGSPGRKMTWTQPWRPRWFLPRSRLPKIDLSAGVCLSRRRAGSRHSNATGCACLSRRIVCRNPGNPGQIQGLSDLRRLGRIVDSARFPAENLTRLHRLGTEHEDVGLNLWRLHVPRWLTASAPTVLFVIFELTGSRPRLLR